MHTYLTCVFAFFGCYQTVNLNNFSRLNNNFVQTSMLLLLQIIFITSEFQQQVGLIRALIERILDLT